MTDDDRSPFVRAAGWLTTVRTTLAFGTLLSAVFLAELWVFERLGFEAFAWLFVAGTAPSPAWLLAAFAHSPFRPVHLVGNLALLVVFGGMTERRLGRAEYVGFLVVAGLASTSGQVLAATVTAGTGPGTGAGAGTVGSLGASGATLAATAYAVVAGGRRKLRTGEWDGETTPVWVVAGLVIVARRLALDLAVGVPGVGRYGHLWGVLFGLGYALVRSGHADAGREPVRE